MGPSFHEKRGTFAALCSSRAPGVLAEKRALASPSSNAKTLEIGAHPDDIACNDDISRLFLDHIR
jgi:hypothetical protein